MDQERKYQTDSIDGIRNAFSQGFKKVLLWLATGGGKTFVFCKITKGAVSSGNEVIIVVRGRKLVDQASKRLFREGVSHGVYMSNHWNFRPTEKVQVCSIDTLIAREITPVDLPAKIIIIDEAHLATSPGYKQFLAQYPDAYVIAVTATPWTEKGLIHVAETVIHPITMQGLVDQGYLVPFRIFAPSAPDLSKVQISSSTKDYVVDQLEDAMIAGQLTGKIVDHWIAIGQNRPTLGFAVNVHHSKLLVEKFLAAGISAEHCDAEIPDSERDAINTRLESGETKVVFNVGTHSTGVDIPRVACIIMARPTKSRNLFVQQAGRGTRIANEKSDCIILDHAGNCVEHGFPTDEPEVDLAGRKAREKSPAAPKVCKSCFCVYKGPRCPECGIEPPPMPVAEIKESDGHLQEIDKAEMERLREMRKALREAPGTGWRGYSGRK